MAAAALADTATTLAISGTTDDHHPHRPPGLLSPRRECSEPNLSGCASPPSTPRCYRSPSTLRRPAAPPLDQGGTVGWAVAAAHAVNCQGVCKKNGVTPDQGSST
ncbi:hypothetical protein Kpho02_60200 [Kitasatospora phosalacinea]|uniref:Uncharacterized protein n=1 Tax=Kitasatospora phosalacinea TaxID=2065 RepID=A0A9W6QFU8_9ACTN|nr:hypothetical protein Kpho02_60200 [Kitasatospora phosalacinea]